MRKERAEINTEPLEVLAVRRAGRQVVAWCDGYGEQARVLMLDKEMAFTGASSRAIHRRVEAGQFHFEETAEGVRSHMPQPVTEIKLKGDCHD